LKLGAVLESILTMAPGIFPTMPPSEITHYLGTWGITISHEQLLRPSPEFVESVYYACLEEVTGTSTDTVRESVQNALATLEDGEQARLLPI
jgi:kinetochore protein Nuf2